MAKMTVYSLSIVQMKKIQDVMLKACAENEAIGEIYGKAEYG